MRRNGPLLLRTYGRHRTKVETWLSPDIRKKAFSSTSSSDLSLNEQNSRLRPRKKKKMVSTASSRAARTAKQKALKALVLIESEEESDFVLNTSHHQEHQQRSSPVMAEPRPGMRKRVKLLGVSMSGSEDGRENKMMRPGLVKVNCEDPNHLKCRTVDVPSDLGKFVSARRRVKFDTQTGMKPRRMKVNQHACSVNDSLNSTEDFVKNPHLSHCHFAKRKIPIQKGGQFLDSTGSGADSVFLNLSHTNILQEVSMDGIANKLSKSCYKKPLLSSTPSLAFKAACRHYEPSVSEISFNDEVEDVLKCSLESNRNAKTPRLQELKRRRELQNTTEHFPLNRKSRKQSNCKENLTVQLSKELFSHDGCDHGATNKCDNSSHCVVSANPSLQLCQDSKFVSAKTHLDSFISGVKEKCVNLVPVVHLVGMDIANYEMNQNNSKQKDVYFSVPDCGMALNSNQSGGMESVKKTQASLDVSADKDKFSNVCYIHDSDVCTDDLSLGSDKGSPSLVYMKSWRCSNGGGDSVLSSSTHSQKQCLKQDSEHMVTEYSNDLFTEVSLMDQKHGGGRPSSLIEQDDVLCHMVDAPVTSRCALESLVTLLKEQCLASQPTVTLKALDLSKYVQASKNTSCSLSKLELKDEGNVKLEVSGCDVNVPPKCSERKGCKISGRYPGSRNSKRLASMCFSSAAKMESFSSECSPAGKRGAGELKTQELPKDRQGTGRKACVSGFSVSRWAKRDRRKPPDPSRSLLAKRQHQHFSDSSFGHKGKTCLDTVNSWLQGAHSVLPAMQQPDSLDVSSLLASLSPNCMTTHTWSRLKAALSVHKKTKAVLTPKRLQLSYSKSSDVEFDRSEEPVTSPQCTPLSVHKKLRLPLSVLDTPLSYRSFAENLTDADKVYHECQQKGPVPFEQCISPAKMKLCKKIGEGTFGEVFSTVSDSMDTVALKIIPIEGSQKVNGEDQKTFGEVLHEIIISKELSSLCDREQNRTEGFIGLRNLHCVRGSYPKLLLDAWDKFSKQRGSENDCPDFFAKDQLFLVLEFEFGGIDLENMNGQISSFVQAKSILHQVTVALAVAEQALCFEHRDLHWGNILVKTTKEKAGTYVLDGISHNIETKGVLVSIIDYSLSRLEIDDLIVSCDISADEELFMGQGDYQYDIYRKMREENCNSWSEYNPHTNVLWLHYLADKLLHMRYKTKQLSKPMKNLRKSLVHFCDEALGFKSATHILQSCPLFQ